MKKLPSDRIVNGLVYLMSFLISAAGMVFIIKARGFYPFKDTTMFVMDMRDQYVEFFASLRYLFSGENSLFFSWSRSMGGNYLGLFAYYIASPLSFITVFFSLEQMPLAIAVLSVLKIGLCGLSFSMYASYLWKRRENALLRTRLAIIPLAVSYALMSYNITYLLCLMWLDGVIFLPWILLGVEKILDGGKGLHYLLALTALFFCNYYTGYMVGLFTALYILWRSFTMVDLKAWRSSLRDLFGKLLRFTITTLLSLGLSAPLLLPVIRDLATGRLSTATYVPENPHNFEPFSLFFEQLANGAYKSLDNSGLPAVYCGYLVLALALLFFLLPSISLREKTGALLLLALLSLSFYERKWDLVWHGFKSPVCFPYRYAFLFGFLLLYLAVRAACCIPMEKFSMEKFPKFWRRIPVYEGILLFFMLFTAMDLGSSGRDILFAIGDQFAYNTAEDYKTFLASTQPLVTDIKEADGGLYRINQSYEFSKNDSMLLGYNGMTHYSSTFNQSVNTLTKKLGIAQIHFWNSGYGSTPMLDSLFGVKYLLADRPVPALYSKRAQTDVIWEEDAGNTASYENPLALPFAYSAPAATLSPDLSSADPFQNQNAFLNAIAGTRESFFTEYQYTAGQDAGGWSYTFTADSDNPVYLYLVTDESSYAPKTVLVNGKAVGGYFSSETLCSLYLGSFVPGEQVVVEIPEQTLPADQVLLAQLHMDILEPVLENLLAKGMLVESHRGGSFQGSITVSENELILTSIPYDKGWTVRLDGKKVETSKFADTFLAVSAESGEHTIRFSYVSPGFRTGMLLCLAAVFLCVLYFRKQ